MTELRAFTVKAHWGLLIRSGLKTCENRSFRVPPGFYLVHASGSLSFSEWRGGYDWVADRFGTAIIFPSFDLCRSWCGQILCGITVVSALTQSKDPWYNGADVAWELERPVPFAKGLRIKGQLGVWKCALPVAPQEQKQTCCFPKELGMQLDEIRKHIKWWDSLSQEERGILFRLGLNTNPTIKDRLLADIAKQAKRDAKRAEKKGKAEKAPK